MKTPCESLPCKVCGSQHTVKDGKVKGVQRWECRTCGRKFLDNGARPGMKTPFHYVHFALTMYYGGMSLNTVCRQLQQKYNNYSSVSTVYEWINRYSHKVESEAVYFYPEVGDTWVIDETDLTIWGKQLCIWDVIDRDTGFLLASLVSQTCDTKDVQTLIEKATGKARKTPRVLIAGKLAPFIKSIQSESVADIQKELEYFFTVDDKTTTEDERFHPVFQNRVNLIRELKTIDKVIEFINGWLIYYNYFRPQEYLGGKRPAESANIECPYTLNKQTILV
jgi:putative transposase